MIYQKIKENLSWLIFGLVAVLIAILIFIQLKWVNDHTYKEMYGTTVTIIDKKKYTTIKRTCGKWSGYHTKRHYMIYYETNCKGIKRKGSIDSRYIYDKYDVKDKEKATLIVWYYADNTDKEGQIYGTRVIVDWKY